MFKPLISRLFPACVSVFLCMALLCGSLGLAESVQPTDSVLPQTPAPTQTPVPQASAPQEPAQTPGATGTASSGSLPSEPAATPGPSDTAPPPACEVPGCAHVAVDEHGNPAALCPLGEWLLQHPQELPAPSESKGMALMAATAPTAIVLPDRAYTLYRSGTYELSGGGPNCQLIVSKNILVSLKLANGTVLNALSLGAQAVAEITFEGASMISTVSRGSDTVLRFLGSGSIAVGSLSGGGISVSGGSVCLPAGVRSENGRACYVFPASGAASAMVDGVAYPFTQPHTDGNAYLWLSPPAGGALYRASVEAGVLQVYTEDPPPATSATYNLTDSAHFAPTADTAYTLEAGNNPQAQTLVVNQPGVKLLLNGLAASVAAVQAEAATTLYLSGDSALSGIAGGSAVSLSGRGSLTLATLANAHLSLGSGVTLYVESGSVPVQGQSLPVSGGELSPLTRATLDGRPVGLCFSSAAKTTAIVAIPAPAGGNAYEAVLVGNELKITTVPQGGRVLELKDAGVILTAGGSYEVFSSGGVSGSIVIDTPSAVTLVLSGATTSGDLILRDKAQVTLKLQGVNRAGRILCGDNSALSVSGIGALHAASVGKSGSGKVSFSILPTTNLSLSAGQTIPFYNRKPNVVFVTGADGSGLRGRQVTLKISPGNQKPFTTTTNESGHLWLWQSSLLTGVDLVVLDHADTYATIIVGGSGDADALPEISGIGHTAQSAVTYSVTNASTHGVQYYLNPADNNMPDTYLPKAGRVLSQGGECNIPGLKNGDRVVLRVFASRLPGAVLGPNTADAFQFSPVYTFTAQNVRVPFTLAAQKKTYDAHPFQFENALIPAGATVTWYQGAKPLSGPPTEVGVYTAKVAIPKNSAKYVPGVVDVQVTILGYVVWIYPEFYYKVQGEGDPRPFLYSYSDMPFGGAVTGSLTRIPGEKPGNYAYLTENLVAPDCYLLRIDPQSPMFFIDYSPHHYMPFDPLARIDPVHDTVVFSDGKKLDLIRATVEKLNISGVGYGPMVTDSESGGVRPFTASLRLRPGYNAALLILQAEPELNKDGGYATDLDGNPLVRGRRLTLTYAHLQHFKAQRITHIAFGLEGTFCFLNLEELQGEAIESIMVKNAIPRMGTKFTVTVSPILSPGAVPAEASAALEPAELKHPVTDVRMELANQGNVWDIAPVQRSARVLFDASALLETEPVVEKNDISETVIGKKPQPAAVNPDQTLASQALAGIEGREEPTVELMELARQVVQRQMEQLGYSLRYYADRAVTLDSKLVVPYTASEAEVAIYTAILQTRPYLMTPVAKGGLYGLAPLEPAT